MTAVSSESGDLLRTRLHTGMEWPSELHGEPAVERRSSPRRKSLRYQAKNIASLVRHVQQE